MAVYNFTPQPIKRSSSLQSSGDYSQGLPLTIDPMYINGRTIDTTSSNTDFKSHIASRSSSTPDIQMTPLAQTPASSRQRPTLVIDQTPPQYLSGPASASSSFESGYLTPYTSTTTSTCSSRRDSMIHLDSAQHYSLGPAMSPSPHARENAKSFDGYSFTDTLAGSQVPCMEPAILMSDDRSSGFQFADELVPMEANSMGAQWIMTGPASLQHCHSAPGRFDIEPYPQQHVDFPPTSSRSHRNSMFPGSQADIEHRDLAYRGLAEPFEYQSSSSSPEPIWGPLSHQDLANEMPARIKGTTHRQRKSKHRVTKQSHSKASSTSLDSAANLIDVGPYTLEQGQSIAGQGNKPNKCGQCIRAFARPEHLGRHLKTHVDANKKEWLNCPICEKPIQDRPDNRKAHVLNTHFKPSEKKPTKNINTRITMRELLEEYTQDKYMDRWKDFFQIKQVPNTPPPTRDEIWRLIRTMDPRWERLLSNRMTVHDTLKNSSKPDKAWTMLGWTIEETQNIRVKDIVPDWEGCPGTTSRTATLWDLDPRRQALLDGSLTIDDADHLGVDMMKTQEMELDNYDPRWISLKEGQMSVEDSERYGVKHLNPQWILWQSKRGKKD